MTVIVLTAVPPALRGVLTRWLFEIAPGVFVGHVSARVRELLWSRIIEGLGRGRAILVHSARNEQHLDFRTFGHDWEPVDFEGITLMLRPDAKRPGPRRAASGAESREGQAREPTGGVPRNWSYAERRLRGRG